jgi:hypothetical protein
VKKIEMRKTTGSTREEPRKVTLNGCARVERENVIIDAEETKTRKNA